MNVLWFCLTPSLAEEYLTGKKHYGLGWIGSLEKQISSKVKLSVAFYSENSKEPFLLNNTTYYPINKFRYGKASKFFSKVNNHIESPSDVKQYARIIDLTSPDIIHIHGTEGPFGLIQGLTSVPIVFSIQGIISVCLIKYFSGIKKIEVLKHTSISSRLLFRSYYRKYKLFELQAKREVKILKPAKFIIGRTDWDRRVTRILAPHAEYFHNDEILRDSFYKQRWECKSSFKFSLITVMSPNLFKGIETVLNCAKILDELNFSYSWSVVGLNSKDDLVNITRKSLNIKVSPNIRFLGILNENSLIQELMKSNIYISASHIENSSNSLCEALLLGLPSIATDAGGSSSLIDNKRDGIIIQDGDPYSMAGAIIELYENYDKALEYGDEARKRAIERHSLERISNELISIYNKIIRSSC